MDSLPQKIGSRIGPREILQGETFTKRSPHNGTTICEVVCATRADLDAAIPEVQKAQNEWAALPGVRRGEILFGLAGLLQEQRNFLARIAAWETGKSLKDALGEVDSAVAQGNFMAAEGQRSFGRTTFSGTANRHPLTIREPVGLAGLITAANAPVANLAWKIFPALICGNAALVKASEHAPLSAWAFAEVAANSALPAGLLSFWQGKGNGIGSALVEHPWIPLVSFTGSTKVGRGIAAAAGTRLAKVGLELGGKNPLVVCDDADLDKAVHWAALSAFSNAGQRCASASRILVFESVYNAFREKFLAKVKILRVGPSDEDDLGPVIHEQSLANILEAVSRAQAKGAKILAGGQRLVGENHKSGSYMAPTVLENVSPDDDYSKTELFGPVTALYPVRDFAEAVALANRSPYGLTASIHTRSWNRAQEFQRRVEAGVVVVNGGTHGSEPHMPFGGVKDSGNGIREPGPEALDFYSNTKIVYHMVDPLDL